LALFSKRVNKDWNEQGNYTVSVVTLNEFESNVGQIGYCMLHVCCVYGWFITQALDF